MTDHEDIRKALDALNETEFTARCHAVDHLTRHAPQWLAELLAECEALTVKRDRYLHALELVAPDGRGLQLFLGEGPAPGMPMYGSVCTESPYLIATKPEGPDASFAGAREVYQYTYDEDTQHEAERCAVGYFVTEDWLCERDEGAEEKYDEALARAELAETKHASCEAHLRLVTEERERFAEQREGWRARSIANEERAEQAEKERDALKLIASDLARRAVEANEEKRDSLLAENARLQGEIAQHIAFRAEVNDALPRPFGVTVIGAIKALRAEVDAKPAITREDAALVKDYGDMYADKVKAWMPRAVHAALRAHAVRACRTCHGTRVVEDADTNDDGGMSRSLSLHDCPDCATRAGKGECSRCNGKRWVGNLDGAITCPVCHGTGKDVDRG